MVRAFVIASLPAAMIGLWSLGALMGGASLEQADGWQFRALERFTAGGRAGPVASWTLGAMFFVPLLIASLAASRLWAEVFARFRQQPLDSGWLLWGWLFPLLLPSTIPMHVAILGLSFGVVFGAHVFGGTGRYIVNPAILGVAFLTVAYPALFAETAWLPGDSHATSWASMAAASESGLMEGIVWSDLLFGREIGALGTASAAACLLGAAVLVLKRTVSLAVIASGLGGLAVAATATGTLPWHWHLVVGNFAFTLAFVATDPTTRPVTLPGRYAFGALFGVMTVVLRMKNPEHPEGTLFALLLASLTVPALDGMATLGRTYFERASS